MCYAQSCNDTHEFSFKKPQALVIHNIMCLEYTFKLALKLNTLMAYNTKSTAFTNMHRIHDPWTELVSIHCTCTTNKIHNKTD